MNISKSRIIWLKEEKDPIYDSDFIIIFKVAASYPPMITTRSGIMRKSATPGTVSSSEQLHAPVEKTYHTFDYLNIRSLEETIQEETCNTSTDRQADEGFRLSFYNVPTYIIDEYCAGNRGQRLIYYNKEKHILQFAIPSRYHESAAVIGEKWIEKALQRSHMARAMSSIRCSKAPNREKTTEAKMPDVSFVLNKQHCPYNVQEWPQLVLEVGYSESDSQLLKDVRHWFRNGGACVRVVLTIKMNSEVFHLSAWTVGENENTMYKRGDIIAKKVGDNYEVEEDCEGITIPFEILFFRPREGDEKELQFLPQDLMELQRDILPGEEILKQGDSESGCPFPQKSSMGGKRATIHSPSAKEKQCKRLKEC